MTNFYGAGKPNWILKNAKTGNEVELPNVEKTNVYSKKHFWKADLAFFDDLCLFNSATSKVLAYVIRNVKVSENVLIGDYKSIARKLACDAETVRKSFSIMVNNDILVRTDKDKGWMLNPRLLVKGDLIRKALLMSQYDSLCGRQLGDVILTDSEGNAPVRLPKEYLNEQSVLQQKEFFLKLYNGFFDIMAGLSRNDFEVLRFLLMAMNYSENMYIGTMNQIAVNCNCSRGTVCRAMESLTEKGLVAMYLNSCWLINPSVVIKGNPNKERMLMEQFVEAQKNYNAKKTCRKNCKATRENKTEKQRLKYCTNV